MATLEELERRVTALEQELARLRLAAHQTGKQTADRTSDVRSVLGKFMVDQALISAGIDKAFQEMGIKGEPVGPEKLQKMVAACGFKPEDNEFSREIIAMREE